MVVYGGSDGVNSFADVHVLDIREHFYNVSVGNTLIDSLIASMVWTRVQTNVQIQRLSHTSTQVGSYLFVIGGHDGRPSCEACFPFPCMTDDPYNRSKIRTGRLTLQPR
jgi:hypothetical protein